MDRALNDIASIQASVANTLNGVTQNIQTHHNNMAAQMNFANANNAVYNSQLQIAMLQNELKKTQEQVTNLQNQIALLQQKNTQSDESLAYKKQKQTLN